MRKIYSKCEEGSLLHIIVRKSDILGRVNVCPDEEFLQLALIEGHSGKTFKPHKHIFCEKITNIAQESWVVIQGRVKAILYDLDDTIISEEILEAGDASITFRGGHNYLFLSDNSLVYEYKTGPYLGQNLDKKMI